MKFQCPCCGYYTLSERAEWEICQVCFWDDDDAADVFGVVSSRPPFGPNYVSLEQARKNFLAFGAKEERLKKYVRPPRPDEIVEN